MKKLIFILSLVAITSSAFADETDPHQKDLSIVKKNNFTVGLVRAGLLMDWKKYDILIAGGDLRLGADRDNPLASPTQADTAFTVLYSFRWKF